MNPGDTFLDFDPTYGAHLWVVVATPGTQALTFNFTTLRPGPRCDTSCIIRAGEHPFVTRDTVVEYRRGFVAEQVHWEKVVAAGGARSHVGVSAAVLLRIQQGALASKFTEQAHQRIIRQLLGIPEPR